MKEITIKESDIITVTACCFHVPDWMDDQPCVLLSPVVQYTETSAASFAIEDFLIDLCCDECAESDDLDGVEQALNWVGRSLASVRRKVNTSLKTGEAPYKSVYSEVISVEARIIKEEDGLSWEEISRKEMH